MTRLTVEIDDFVDAARTFYFDVGEPIREANGELTAVLADCRAMAGEDDGGREWASSYDTAAASVVTATNRLAAAAFATSTLFGRSATNYAAAEAASTSGGPSHGPPINQRLPSDGSLGPASRPPTALGGSNDEPTGWGLVKGLVGYAWPNGHQDRLRRAAEAYRHCATVLESVAIEPARASIRFARDRLPEADDVITVCQGMTERARTLARANHELARSCDELADHLDRSHVEIESELKELTVESVALQTVGAIASLFSFGAAEVPTQIAEAARIASAASKISEMIRRFVAAVRIVESSIPTVTESAQGVTRWLDKLAGTRAVYAGVTDVRRIDRVAAAGKAAPMNREARATARLSEESGRLASASGRGRDVISPRERRHILDGDKNGGGHRWPVRPGKSAFPRSWSDDQILDNVGDIVTSPTTRWYSESSTGGLYTRRGKPAVWRAWEIRDGQRIRVVRVPALKRILSAYPDPDTPSTGVPVL